MSSARGSSRSVTRWIAAVQSTRRGCRPARRRCCVACMPARRCWRPRIGVRSPLCGPTSWPSSCARAQRLGRSQMFRSWTSARNSWGPCRPHRHPRRRRTRPRSSVRAPRLRGKTSVAASSPRRCSPSIRPSRKRGLPWPSVRPRTVRGRTATLWSTRRRSSPPWRGVRCCAAARLAPSRSSATSISAAAQSVPARGRRLWVPRPEPSPPSMRSPCRTVPPRRSRPSLRASWHVRGHPSSTL